jgi:hypothetical protein
MVNFKELDELFSGFSVLDALDCLCWTFGSAQAPVYMDGTRFCLVDIYDDAGSVGLNSAASLKLRWLGGPPDSLKWRDSNLYAMFLDYFLNAYIFGDKELITKVCTLARKKISI